MLPAKTNNPIRMAGDEVFTEFFVSAWNVLVSLAPWFLLGAVLAGLLHGLLPAGFVQRRFRGPWGVVKSVLLGVPLPLCSCGVVPAGIGLKRDGASDGAAVGFLISTPQTGVDSILVSASFLGWPFALFKVFSAGLMGVVGGWLADAVAAPEVRSLPVLSGGGPRMSGRNWRSMWDHGLEIVYSIRYWIVLGVLVSAAIEVLVPAPALASVGQWGTLAACVVALALSLPLYVCATASVPIAAALVAGGFPTGATLVFLMAGPATNVATVGAIYRQFGSRTLAVYLGTIIVGSFGLALLFEGLLSGESRGVALHHHDHHSWWGLLSAGLLLGLLGWFAFRDLLRWWPRPQSDPAPQVTIPVDGMRCGSCAQRLETALRGTSGVTSVRVQVSPGEAVVNGTAPVERLQEAIRACGFQVREASSTSVAP